VGISADDVRHLQPLQSQTLSEEELARMGNLGKNGPREVAGKLMTHCGPNEHVVVQR
jgi:catalase